MDKKIYKADTACHCNRALYQLKGAIEK